MKNISFAVSALLLSSAIFVACTNEDTPVVSQDNTFASIQKDIKEENYWPTEENRYDAASKTLAQFVDSTQDFVVKGRGQSEASRPISLASYKQAVQNFYGSQGYNTAQVGSEFDRSAALIGQYSDYTVMLSDFVRQGIITNDQRNIIISYVGVYSNTIDYDLFVKQTSTYIHNVNQSNYPESQKKILLTIFDGFSANRDLIEKGEKYSFLQITQNIPGPDGKPSMGTKCAGNMLVGMLGGSLGGPIGFVGGFASGLWACYVDGCFD